MFEKRVKIVILAAGIGSRLGNPFPKPLTKLSNGKSILGSQIDCLLNHVKIDDIYVVVGFKKDLIMEEFPEMIYIYNNEFDTTNTSKSLLRGLRKLVGNDVVWLNGGVIFEDSVLKQVFSFDKSCMAVNLADVGDEEIKYELDATGLISQVSKTVANPLGEALGINKINAEDLALFVEKLEMCNDDDYFEKGIEEAIEEGLKIFPIDVSGMLCTEIDFEEDLKMVNRLLGKNKGKK